MGMFDYVNCKYPLPVPDTQDLEYQTKDTDKQWLELYEIREDGSLWTLDVERQGVEDKDAPLGFYLKRISETWRPEPMTGEIEFCASYGPRAPSGAGVHWITYSAYFVKGQLNQLRVIEHERASD